MRLLRYIAYGLAFVLVPEFTNLVIVNPGVSSLSGSATIYAVFLAAGYAIQRLGDRLLRHPLAANGVYIVLFGVLGLMFEWFLIGNSPWGNPDALQWGMFVYWAGLFMIPRILVDDRPVVRPLARRIQVVYLIYSAVHLLIALTLPVAVLPFVVGILWTVVYTAFFLFYWRYVQLLR